MPLQDLPADLPNPASAAVLAFDTSTESLAVGLQVHGKCWAVNQPGGAVASTTLLPTIHALLRQAGCGLGELAAIGFGRGPGAFTGLRTSCAVAQGLAFGLKLPVLPIDSLLIVAEQARRQLMGPDLDLDIGVAMDARMGQLYAARFLRQGASWQVLQPPGLWEPAHLAQAWAGRPPAWVCGSGIGLFAELSVLPARTVALDQDRASALLTLAVQALVAGEAVDAAEALPVYLRDKVAQTTAERAAVQAAVRSAAASAATSAAPP